MLSELQALRVALVEAKRNLQHAELRFHQQSVILAEDPLCSNRPWFDAKADVESAEKLVETLETMIREHPQ